jgi:hypothetical protein
VGADRISGVVGRQRAQRSPPAEGGISAVLSEVGGDAFQPASTTGRDIGEDPIRRVDGFR